jgi:hypothetical protein
MKINSMKRYNLIVLTMALIAASCSSFRKVPSASVNVVPFSDTLRITDRALIYALPMTVFELDFTLERTVEKPGPYAAYSGDLIGISDVIKVESEEWTVKAVTLRPLEEIDPAEYHVLTSSSQIRANSFVLKKAGLILDINSASMNERVVSYAEGDAGFSSLRFNDLGATQYFAIMSDTAYRVVNVDTTFLRIPYLVEKRKPLTRDQLAERAARALLELREGRHLILTGEATVFPQHEAAINEINRLEKEYLSLFAGKTWSEQVNMKVYFTPDGGKVDGVETLFRLSDVRGVTNSSDASATPVTIALVPAGKTRPLHTSGDIQLLGSDGFQGLTYRIPEVAEVTIKHGNSTLLRTRTIVHQLGQKVLIPENVLITR